MEYKVLSVTLKSPQGIQASLNRLGAEGWCARGATASVLFLEKTSTSREAMLTSITLRGPVGIRQQIERSAGEGWELGAMGASFLFFDRPSDGSGRKLGYEVASITLRSLAGSASSPMGTEKRDGNSGHSGRASPSSSGSRAAEKSIGTSSTASRCGRPAGYNACSTPAARRVGRFPMRRATKRPSHGPSDL